MNARQKRVVGVIAVAVIIAAVPILTRNRSRTPEETRPYIAVVSKGEQHDFWQQVKRGSIDAAEKHGVDMTFEGPPSESDVQAQVEMLNNAIAKQPIAIALAALDTMSVIDQLTQVRDAGIPVIGFDSGVPNAPAGSIIANASTDNYAAAGMAAEKMFAEIKDEIEAATAQQPVRIVVINQDATGESLLSRGKGFRDRIVELISEETALTRGDIQVTGNPGYIAQDSPTEGEAVIIDMIVPASSASQDAMVAASAVLNRALEETTLGIFCSNEATVKGLLAATDDGSSLPQMYPSIVVIGYDAGAGQKHAVREGYFLGSVTQDPYSIGYHAIEMAFSAYQGQSVSDIDTGAKFYTASTMDDPEIAPLLYD